MGFKDVIIDDDFNLDRIISYTAFSCGIGNEFQKRNILRNIKHHECVRVGGNNINNLRYANETVLTADSEEKLQNILKTVTAESENKGLQVNTKKTECMVISKQSDIAL